MGVCVRLGISDGSNESVNRSIAIWYSDWVCVCRVGLRCREVM